MPHGSQIRDAMLRYGDYGATVEAARRYVPDDAKPPKPKARPRRPEAAEETDGNRIISVARKYLGLSERSDRRTLMGIFSSRLSQKLDPVRTPWCAAFINAVLAEAGLPTTGSNMGASFTTYGRRVSDPMPGDIIVIRGGRNSRTHVGIFVGTETRGGKKYVKLLGGNQSNHVKVSSYLASRIVSIRRAA